MSLCGSARKRLKDLIVQPYSFPTGKINNVTEASGHCTGLTTPFHSRVKFSLGADLGSASPPPILTTSGENAKLTQEQHLGANFPPPPNTHTHTPGNGCIVFVCPQTFFRFAFIGIFFFISSSSKRNSSSSSLIPRRKLLASSFCWSFQLLSMNFNA